MFRLIALAVVAVLGGVLAGCGEASLADAVRDDTQEEDSVMAEKATFGAGCFWHVESSFQEVPGVMDTAVGFMGGHVENPSYKQVCAGGTGHTEVVHLHYDPQQVSYARLLDAFFAIHDPTSPNRQGLDIGYQYRSVIFYHSPGQEQAAEAKIRELEGSGEFGRPMVTAVEPASTFWPAEDYHQDYMKKRGITSRCPI